MRPKLHYRPEKNWINDPNGLCQIGGWYHLFYQYNPHGTAWGDMHWGHARSRDLYRWEDLPIALTPDEGRGEIHCFSGSCCRDAGGRPHFFYTSIGREADGRDCVNGARQWMAEPSDAALTRLVQTDAHELTDAIHGGMHVSDWRDPCVVRYRGQYVMVLGGCAKGRGCVLLYTSPDMRAWTYRHILLASEEADGVPWECPNLLITDDDRTIVFWSPCAQVRYAVGRLDEEMHFVTERTGLLDPAGRQGYYAPQAFRDEQGRLILMGWMPECDGDAAAEQRGWSGVMALPRELSIRSGDLYAAPVPGWEACTEVPETLKPTRDAGGDRVTARTQAGQHYILRMNCRTANAPAVITLLASPDGEEKTLLTLTPDGMLSLDRSASTLSDAPETTPISREVCLTDGCAEAFLCVDGTTVEVMVNGRWLSGRVYPQRADSAMLVVSAEAVGEAMLYRMK